MVLKFRFISIIVISCLIAASCSTSNKISYFQDAQNYYQILVAKANDIRLKKDDKISIMVNSKDQLLTNLFNLPITSTTITATDAKYVNTRGLSGYTVDSNGEIDFPVLGKVKVEGLKREEVAANIKDLLMSRNLVKDPVVTVEYMNLTISVLGEVNSPGKYGIEKDKVTVLDALSMAGDLTIFGNRDRVLVMRNVDGVQNVYRLDLRSAHQIYTSDVYYLQQDDVVYVEPNTVKARQSTVNGNNVRSATFWLSIISILTTITMVFVRK